MSWNRTQYKAEGMGKPPTRMTGVWEHCGPGHDCVKTRDETEDLCGSLPRTKTSC